MNYMYKLLTLAIGAIILSFIVFLSIQWANLSLSESRFEYLNLSITTAIIVLAGYNAYRVMKWTWLAGTVEE